MLKKYFQASFVILTLMVSFSVQAGFREALSALQHKDAEKMLIEVDKAVKSNNYDGVYLFVGTLNYQYRAGYFLEPEVRKKIDERMNGANLSPLPEVVVSFREAWANFLSNSQIDFLAQSLEKLPKFDDVEDEIRIHLLIDSLKGVRKGIDSVKRLDADDNFRSIYVLALVKLGIKNLEQYGYAETTEIKKLRENTKVNVEDGYALLEKVLVEISSKSKFFYESQAVCLIADAYYEGIHNHAKDLYQAYLWYARAYIRGGYFDETNSNCGGNGLLKLYNNRELSPINATLEKEIKNLNNKLPPPEKILVTDLPQLIVDFGQSQPNIPIFSVFNNSPHYYLKVYADGVVKYSASNPPFDIGDPSSFSTWIRSYGSRNVIVGKDEWKVKPQTLVNLKNALEVIGFNKLPNNTMSILMCDTGEYPTESEFVVRSASEEKFIRYQSWWGHKEVRDVPIYPSQSAIFAIVEKYIPTQHLRCGEEMLSSQYLDCVAVDNKIKEAGEAWIREQAENNHAH